MQCFKRFYLYNILEYSKKVNIVEYCGKLSQLKFGSREPWCIATLSTPLKVLGDVCVGGGACRAYLAQFQLETLRNGGLKLSTKQAAGADGGRIAVEVRLH